MRTTIIMAAVAACLGLTACEQSKSEATEAAPAPKKSLSRPAPLYAGQEQILSIDSATVERAKADGALQLTAQGKTEAAGYYQLAFLPRINAAPPADGIYEVDVIGYKPQGAAAQAVTPVEVKGEWARAPMTHLKGVRFVTKTNSVVAMLPPAG